MQLRGQRLLNHIESRLSDLILEYQAKSQGYIYGQKEFAAFANISRESVRKYQKEIDVFLNITLIPKHSFDHDAKCRNLQERNTKLQDELSKSRDMYNAIRIQYINIFDALLSHSVDVHVLVARTVETLEVERRHKSCVLCGTKLDIDSCILRLTEN